MTNENKIQQDTTEKSPAKETLTQIYNLWENGKHLESLKSWFGLPLEQRDEIINNVMQENVNEENYSLQGTKNATEGTPSYLVFKHYALLASPEVEKLILPDDTNPLTKIDLSRISNSNSERIDFQQRINKLGLYDEYGTYNDDFIDPDNDLVKNLSLEEAREFLVNLIPHLNEEAKTELIYYGKIISHIKWADLLTDPRLTTDLEMPILQQYPWFDSLTNYIVKEVYPSAKFFEIAFEKLETKTSKNEDYSLYYYLLLRNVKDPDTRTLYLLNNDFMECVNLYLKKEEVHPDNYFYLVGEYYFEREIEAKGEEAKKIKQSRLNEVIKTAIDYANQNGNEETATKLAKIHPPQNI